MTKDEMLKAGPLPACVRELRDAVRRGDKTETRRVGGLEFINKKPNRWQMGERSATFNANGHPAGQLWRDRKKKGSPVVVKFPFQPGLKYLREPLVNVNGWAFYADDDTPVATERGVMPWRWNVNKLSQRFMPREAARTFVRVSEIVAERLQEITELAALREGVMAQKNPAFRAYGDAVPSHRYRNFLCGDDLGTYWLSTAVQSFRSLWDSINALRERGKFAWRKNPWVWVIRFKLELHDGKKK